MDALKLRKDVSKPGLLRVAREVFDAVVEEVGGRKLSTGDRRMSGPWRCFWSSTPRCCSLVYR